MYEAEMELTFTMCTYADLATDRETYLRALSAPLDGMWENAFLPMSNHRKILCDGRAIGFCSTNSDGKMLGFSMPETTIQRDVFSTCIEKLGVSGAFVSTAEPDYLSLCADHQVSMSVNALMYAEDGGEFIAPNVPAGMNFRSAQPGDIEEATAFAALATGANREWLSGYFQQRISLGELYGLWSGDELVSTGECRISPNQAGIADVGMIVAPAYRKRGLATFMLKQLRMIGHQAGRQLICSTEAANIPAQIAIERAGFVPRHRLLEFTF